MTFPVRDTWELHEEPHRHYKVTPAGAKPTWNAADKQRIASVTSVLDEGEGLIRWNVQQALAAGEMVVADFFGDELLRTITPVGFPELCRTTGLLGDQVRDAKGATGDLAHDYMAARLRGEEPPAGVPYGLRVAMDDFLRDAAYVVPLDRHGRQIERAVGDYARAVAGTYDFRMLRDNEDGTADLHRVDLKQSASLHGKHFAQLAAYERCAVLCGETPSHLLSLLHITPSGQYRLVSIAVGSPEHHMALDFFDAALVRYRLEARLDKLVAPPKETEPA